MRYCLILFLFSSISVGCAQQNGTTPTDQERISKKFILFFIHEQYDSCWTYFDRSMNPEVDLHGFKQTLRQMRLTLKTDNDNIALFMHGFKIIDGQNAPFYSFHYDDDVNKPPGFLFDVIFADSNSALVAGFQPKGRADTDEHAATSRGKEIEVSGNEKIKIKSGTYQVRGVNVVEFRGGEGLIVVQVEMDFPKDSGMVEDWADQESVKFAKWLYKSKHFDAAQKVLEEQEMKKSPGLGVSFVDPISGMGYNVIVEEKDYR